ncbi:MarR family winged helix-turn-helix transcriptional regulator [Ramlibacter sp.]|uniref:MarR family winged helix-turn-helix transcriptional regulator n=1 Tax=Ramlibacter sp. TaxID=1917967 RepID=UPI002FC5830D
MTTAKTPRKKSKTAESVQPPARVLRRFRLVFNAIKAHFRSVEKKAGISGAQVWALSVVRDQPGIGVGDLARAMDVHQSTASNLLRALIDAGLVVSGRGAADRRAVQLQVTPKGQRILKKAPGPFTGLLPDALQRLDTATLNRLDRDLGRLIDELGIDERGASFPLGSGD